MKKKNNWQYHHVRVDDRLNISMPCCACHRYHKANEERCKNECIFAGLRNEGVVDILEKALTKKAPLWVRLFRRGEKHD